MNSSRQSRAILSSPEVEIGDNNIVPDEEVDELVSDDSSHSGGVQESGPTNGRISPPANNTIDNESVEKRVDSAQTMGDGEDFEPNSCSHLGKRSLDHPSNDAASQKHAQRSLDVSVERREGPNQRDVW